MMAKETWTGKHLKQKKSKTERHQLHTVNNDQSLTVEWKTYKKKKDFEWKKF